MADVKSLEHPTLKVPYEVLNKKFRSAQKNIDREIAHVQTAASDLEKCFHGRVTVGEVTTALDTVVEKLSILKRKADESIQDELEAAKTCKRRVEHLKVAESAQGGAVTVWRKKRLDRMLVEYFLRAGYYNTALKLARHSELVDLTNIDLFLTCKEVEESLIRHETAACLSWCHDNRSKLRKMKSNLEFNLRQQEYVELIRSNKRLEAVRHARKYFTSPEEEQVKDIQKVMGLLAFPCDTGIKPYQDLLDPARWQDLVEQFREDNYKLHQLNSMSILTVTLQAGLSALKTPHCYKEKNEQRNADCPVCTRNLNQLAQPLPYAHCSNSRLICSISGLPLNEHNPPLMLPNGHVYGLSALANMAAENEGRVVCPRTSSIFNLEEADKVFVM